MHFSLKTLILCVIVAIVANNLFVYADDEDDDDNDNDKPTLEANTGTIVDWIVKNYGNNAEKVAEGIQDVSPPDSTTTVYADLQNLSHDQMLDKEAIAEIVQKQREELERQGVYHTDYKGPRLHPGHNF